MSLYKYVQTFLWNIRDSFRFSLRKVYKKTQAQDKALHYIWLSLQNLDTTIVNDIIKPPKIRTPKETINEIITTNKSFVSYGDGEIYVADGKDMHFQKTDPKLSKRLQEILQNQQENLLVGICSYWYGIDVADIIVNGNSQGRRCMLYEVPFLLRSQNKWINFDTQYYSADIKQHSFNTWRKFFNNKKLVLVGCKEAFESYEFNIFDTALKLDYEFVPNKHCFSVYDEILTRLLNYDKDTIRILMCGPTANVLAADLTKEGFRALDLGHLAKFYDWYKRGIDINANDGQNILKFHAPDE